MRESEEFSVGDADDDVEDYDAYKAFEKIVREGKLQKDDLVLIDPFSEFLKEEADKVIPQIKEVIEQGAAVILFALNLDPCNSVGRKFEKLLKDYLPKARRMTMPPLRYVGIKGESKYHAEVVLAASILEDEAESNELKKRLDKLAERLADILKISDSAARLLKPQTCRP